MIRDEEDNYNEIKEAKRIGHKFIKIYLHPDRIGRNQKQIIISGAVVLRGFPTGMDSYGSQAYQFVERRGDSMVFNFDPEEREYICWLYDDPGQGYFSETGYNRDLLASHYEENTFIIKDTEVLADVKRRYDYMKANPNKKYEKKTSRIKSLNTVQELDEQIKILEQRKDILLKVEDIKTKDEKPKTVPVKNVKKGKLQKVGA